MMDSNTEERHQKVAAAMAHLYGADLIKAVDDAVALELSNHPVSHPALVKLLLDLRIEYVARETIVLACLKKDKDWDLDPSHGLFHHFRFKRLAEIFRQHPHMVEVMKTRARNETYNVGYNQQIALYNEVATRLDDATLLGDFAFDGDKKYGITEDPEKEGTVAETWVVMDHLIERQNNWVCTAYPEYKTIPRRSECIIQEQRTTRSPKRGPIGLVSPLVKDSQVKTRASSSPKGVRKSSSSPKGIRKASSSPKRTRKASLSPKRIPKAPLLQRDAPIARRRVTRGTTLGLLSSKEPTDASPALRPAFARRRMSSSSTFSTIIVAPAKGYEA